MNSRLLRHGRTAAAALVVVAAGAACSTDRATVFDPVGPNSYDFHLANAPSVAAAGLPSGSVKVTAGTPNTVTLKLDNLNRLSGGVYKVWVAVSASDQLTDVTPLVGDVTFTDADGNATTTTGTSTFADGGAGTEVVLTAPLPASPAFNVAFVSIESGTGTGTTPAAAMPLWGTLSTTSKALTFGTFAAKASDRYAYFINGHGEGGVRGTTLVVDDTLIARPPVGYYYGAFLVKGDESDTLYLGELTAPFPRRNVSLRDADVSIVDPVVETSPPVLHYASILFDGTKANLKMPLPYQGLDNFFISLIAKQGVQGELPPNVVTAATLPDIVTTPPATP